MNNLQEIASRCIIKCKQEKWKCDWSNGGCYLHLEVSEFIEALRGKGGNPAHEAADVLFVLLAMMKENKISFADTFDYLNDEILKGVHY